MESESSQSQPKISVSKGAVVGVVNTGGDVHIEGDLIVQSSSQEFEIEDFDLSRPISTFRGRDLEMQTLDTLFFTQNKKKVAICGLPGFGKSELSKQYANICLQTKKIDKAFWINSDNKDILHRSFRCLKKIYKSFDKTRCLFIFDNSLSRQDIIEYEPPANENHFLLITSQEKNWDDAGEDAVEAVVTVKLEPLSLGAAVDVYQSILKTSYKNEDQDLYEELAGVVGNVPLGLQITGAYIRLRIRSLGNDFKLEEYITLLKQSQKEFIDVKLPKFAANTYGKSIFGAIKISVDKIRDEEDSETRDLALNVLCLCCFLHPYFINNDIFLEMSNITEIMTTVLDKSKLHLAIDMLDNYMFLDYNRDNKQITIHRFTQEILQFYLGKSEPQLQMNCFCSCLDFAKISDNLEWDKFILKPFHICHILTYANNNTSILSNYCSNHLSKNDKIFDTILVCSVRFGFQKCLAILFEHFGSYTKEYIIKKNLIHFAIRGNNLDILELLVQYVDVNSTSDGQNTALHTAASRRNLNAIKILIEHNADTSLKNAEGNTPLFSFIESYRGGYHINLNEITEICELLNCDENKNTTNNMGQTLVHVAAAACQEQLVTLLANKYKMNVNERDLHDRTPLHSIILNTARYTLHTELIIEMSDIFTDFKQGDELTEININNILDAVLSKVVDFWEPVLRYVNIMQMYNNEDISIKEFKLDHKRIMNRLINYNKKYTNGKNTLLAEISTPFFKDENELLEHKNLINVAIGSLTKIAMIINERINNGYEYSFKTLISEFKQDNKCNVKEIIGAARELIKQGAKIENKDKDNKTPLDYALFYKLYYLADLFLFDDNAYELHSTLRDCFNLYLYGDNETETQLDITETYLLHKAVFCVNLEILKLLLQSGIDVNSINKYQDTALHTASFLWHFSAMGELIVNDANINVKNYNGETPLFYFIRGGYFRENITESKINVAFQALHFEENKNILNNKGQTLLYVAVDSCRNNTTLLNLLLQRNLDVNSKNEDQATPLHAGAFHWNLLAIKLLVKHKADLTATNRDGETALFSLMQGAVNQQNINLNEANEIFDLLNFEENKYTRNNKGESLIHYAAKFCCTELLNLLLERRLNINITDDNQNMPLHSAVTTWNIPAIKFLINHKVDINAKNGSGDTALFCFIRNASKQSNINVKDVNKIFDLLQLDQNKTTLNNAGFTILSFAAFVCSGNTELLNQILIRGFDVNSTANDNQITALHIATRLWNIFAIKFLIERKADLNVTDCNGETALFYFIRGAIFQTNINLNSVNEIFDLLKLEEFKNTTNNKGQSLLHAAAESCHENTELMLNLLIEHDLNVNSLDIDQNTPLHIATIQWNLVAIKFLVDHNADLNATNCNGETVLYHFIRKACMNEKINIDEINEFLILLKLKENCYIRNNERQTLMHIAAALCNNTELLNLLLQHGLDINSKNETQATPLHAGAFNWNLLAMKFLVERNVDQSAKNCKGETALFQFIRSACNREYINVDEINEIFNLLKLDENKNTTNNNGQTLLYLAAALCQNTELLNLLLDRDFNINSAVDDVQATALHAAAFHWNLSAIKFLVMRNANLNAQDIQGQTALFHFMCGTRQQENINLDEVQEVLELLQCNKNTTDNNNNTLLFSAATTYREELVSLLLTKYEMNVNHQDLQGNTPLHKVIVNLDNRGSRSQEDVIRIVEILKEHGAKLNIKNKDGKTPLKIAQEMNEEFLFDLLTQTSCNLLQLVQGMYRSVVARMGCVRR